MLAVAIIFAVYQYLKRTAGPARWADSQRSWHLKQLQVHLRGLAADPDHHRDWRPHILALSNDPVRRKRLLRLAEWIGGRSGFTTAVQILEGSGGRMLRRQSEAEEGLRRDIAGQGSSAFPMVVFAAEAEPVLSTLVQSYGVGPLKTNTVLLNWYSAETERDPERLERMNRILRGAYRLGCNILISRAKKELAAKEAAEHEPGLEAAAESSGGVEDDRSA